MIGVLAVALYRCEIAGVPTDSLEIQVRHFSNASQDVEAFLQREPSSRYQNEQGEDVAWLFVRLLALEDFVPGKEGKEILSFVAESRDFSEWARAESSI